VINMTSSQSKPVRQLVVIGLGLIGGSLAKAARERGICDSVIGVARSDEICKKAVDMGVVDIATTSLAELAPSLGDGDMIFIAVPTLSVRGVLQQVRDLISPAVTVTDGASVKGSVLRDVQEVYGETPQHIVLGHPIAGSEKSGVTASNSDLYARHRVILTPTDETGGQHLHRVTALWQGVGAEVLHLSVAEHDEILAATSHLPHAIAFSLVDTLAHDSHNEQIFRYAAGGFRDFTRIASSDAVMWRDIMLANRQAVVKAIDLFIANVTRLRQSIQDDDGDALFHTFERAKAARDHFSAMLAQRSGISLEEE
jgi:3-phosphoshikimate 1-carboxyvinyltransferase